MNLLTTLVYNDKDEILSAPFHNKRSFIVFLSNDLDERDLVEYDDKVAYIKNTIKKYSYITSIKDILRELPNLEF